MEHLLQYDQSKKKVSKRSEKICKWIKLKNVWKKQYVLPGYQLPEVTILFERIDKKIIEEEKAKLIKQEEV